MVSNSFEIPTYSPKVSTHCILGDIRLWAGDPSTFSFRVSLNQPTLSLSSAKIRDSNVKRMWHIQDSQDQILAVSSRQSSLKTYQGVPSLRGSGGSLIRTEVSQSVDPGHHSGRAY
jgi:hypothetical protein